MFKFKTFLERTFKAKPRLDAAAPAERIAAIAALGEDQQTLLAQAALHDDDRAVRLAALGRVTELDALVQALADVAVAEAAAERLLALIDEHTPAAIGNHPAVCRARLAGAQTSAAALAAAAGIEDASERAEALLENPHAEVRTAVAESSWLPAHLAALEKATRGRDKSINQLCRERLKAMRTAAATREEEDARGEHLLNAAAALRDDDRHYDARRDAIERDWAEHLTTVAATDATLAPFGVAARDLDALRGRLPARRRQPRVAAEAAMDFEALLADAEALGGAIATPAAVDEPAAAATAAKNKADQLTSNWNASADAKPPAADVSVRFRAALAKVHVLVDAMQRLASSAADVQNCLDASIPEVEEAESAQAARRDIRRQAAAVERLLGRLAWPEELPAPAPVAALEQRQSALTAAQGRCNALEQSVLAEAEAGIVELRTHVEDGAVRRAVDMEQRLRDLLKQLPRDRAQPLATALAEVGAHVRELRDWRSYAEVGKRQALCDELDALVDNPRAIPEQAEAIKSLRQRWNQLGPAGSRRDRDLKKRFDRAAEKAFEPCRQHFKEQAERRQYNLEQRQTIVAALQSFVADNDWQHADWRGVEQVLRQARAEWRQYHPMDRKAGRQLAVQFEALADDVHARLREEWDRNVARKEAIVAAAKEVRQSSDSATDKADAMKTLQRRWRAVGPLPRRVDQHLWRAFRAECDVVFDARNVVRDRHSERRRTIATAESLLGELERRVDIDPALDRNTIAEYERQINELEPIPKDLQRRAEALVQHADRVVVDRQQAAQRGRGRA